jgi:glycine/D-amino acid oxidase-like deaminating enzyme
MNRPPRADWDAVVVGGSFAGLAAALGLGPGARVLLVDRHPVGRQQTSACAAPLAILERLDALDSLEQVHHEFCFHLPGGRVRLMRLRYPFATFDYARFCTLLLARTEARFLLASARGMADGTVWCMKRLGAIVARRGYSQK